MTPTPEQKAALTAENRDLLVSASAGTGKTTLMVDRVLDMIARRGFTVSRMLVLTFTRAAAEEMRSRLEKELSKAAAENPALERERDAAARAMIGTIDSFCGRVVRGHFQFAGIDPQFRLMDAAESRLTQEAALREAMERVYEQAAAGDGDLAALTAKYEDKQISAMIEALWPFLMARPDPWEWLEREADRVFDADTLEDEPFAKDFLNEAALEIGGVIAEWEKTGKKIERGELLPAYSEVYLDDMEHYRELNRAAHDSLAMLSERLSGFKLMTMRNKTPKDLSPEEKDAENERFEKLKKNREGLKDRIKKLKGKYVIDFPAAAADMNALRPARRGLAKAVLLLRDELAARKARLNAYDFADIEQLALAILRDEKLGMDVASDYDAVFVDEYQDVNRLQEELVCAVKRAGAHVFCVGDVKQSIYRFRQAEPELFAEKMESYSTEENAARRLLFLSYNWRSTTAVQNAVNRVFSHVMKKNLNGIDYDENAALRRQTPSEGDPPVEIHILSRETEQEDGEDSAAAEAAFIAADIRRQLGRELPAGKAGETAPLRAGEILVLLPAMARVGVVFERVLKEAGLAVSSEGASNAAGSEEVRLMLNFLELLENDRDDLRLLAVLRSPLVRFTDGDLAAVRLLETKGGTPFRAALLKAAEEAEEPLRGRVRDFFAMLERERFALRGQPLSDYLWDLLNRSGLLLYWNKREGGAQRAANLQYLCQRAWEWEETHSAGAEEFARTMRREAESNDGATPLASAENADAVRLMTIHKSKGLGERLVYVAQMGRQMAASGHAKAVLADGKLGFMPGYVNEDARVKRETLLERAIKMTGKNADLAERTRLLYVAMTRAKTRLVMVGSAKDQTPEELLRKAEENRSYDRDLDVRRAKTYLDWLLLSAHPEDSFVTDDPGSEFSTEKMLNGGKPGDLSTGFPQKNPVLSYVFHTQSQTAGLSAEERAGRGTADAGDAEPLYIEASSALEEMWKKRGGAKFSTMPFPARRPAGEDDPLLPAFRRDKAPAKLGVTALLRLEAEAEEAASAAADGFSPAEPLTEADAEETIERKRLPLPERKAPALPETAPMPLFLRPEEERRPQGAAARGTATHRVLELLDLGRLRERVSPPLEYVNGQMAAFVEKGLMTADEAALVDRRTVARFLESELCARLLASPRAEREYSFTMRGLSEPETLVQGIIDLCFLEDGAWVLADFKTDRVSSAQELAPRYRRQLEYYRAALERGTPWPVKEAVLFSLALGEQVRVF